MAALLAGTGMDLIFLLNLLKRLSLFFSFAIIMLAAVNSGPGLVEVSPAP